jgi:hypothetical protein
LGDSASDGNFAFFGNDGSGWHGSSLADLDNVWRTYLITVDQSAPLVSFYAGENTSRGAAAGHPGATDPNVGIRIGKNLLQCCGWTGIVGEAIFLKGNGTNPLSSSDRSSIFTKTDVWWGAN